MDSPVLGGGLVDAGAPPAEEPAVALDAAAGGVGAPTATSVPEESSEW
jgi:hypothetical protein